MPLTMTPSEWKGSDNTPGSNPSTTETTHQYRVQGLPESHSALIGHKPGTHPVRWWFIVHRIPDVLGEWHGDYATPEEALAALSKDFPDA